MSAHYPKIRKYRQIYGERYLTIRDSVSICFYMRRSHEEVVDAVMRALDIYRRAVGEQTLAWYPDYEGDWQELDEQGWEFTRKRFRSPYHATIELQAAPDHNTGYEFSYRGRKLDSDFYVRNPNATSAVACWLPTEFLEEHGPARVRELALELAEGLPFNSGYAGVSFHARMDVLGWSEPIRDLCFRYPGLDIPDPSSVSNDIGTRVKGASWLTFLGPPVLGELGGAAGMRERLCSAETSVQELSGGRAVVSLGEWPEAGDTEQGQTLPAYRELARVLAPWLHEHRHPWLNFTPEDMRRWEHRFLE